MGFLAQALPAVGNVDVLERLGTAGFMVLGCYWLVKYFMAQLAKKDARIDDITDRSVTAQYQMTAALEKLTVAIDHLHERRDAQRDR